MTDHLGASPQDWGHFEWVLGLRGNLLPVVPDPNAVPSPHSKVKRFGKIPSAYDKESRAFGLKDWSTRDILDNEVALWRQDPRLGICVRTGSKSGLYALDVDVTDPGRAEEIRQTILYSGCGIERKRADSSKFLVAIEIEGNPVLDKRILKVDDGIIEFLGDGQQAVIAGTHPSGARYSWGDKLPAAFPRLVRGQFEELWSLLANTFSDGTVSTEPAIRTSYDSSETGIQSTIGIDERAQLEAALRNPKLVEDAGDNEIWSEVGYALLSLGNVGRELFCRWSKGVPKYETNGPENWWAAHCDQTPRSDFRHIFRLAKERGWGATASTSDFSILVPPASEAVSSTPEKSQPDPLDIENQPGPDKPTLRLIAGNLANIVKQATQIIRPETYVQGNVLVRVGRAAEIEPSTDAEGIRRASDQRALIRVSTAYLRVALSELCFIERYDGRSESWKVTDCPKDFAEVIVEQKDWPTLRPLDAIVRAPFVRVDGSVCDTAGYDYASHAFYIPSATFPKLAAEVSMADARAALDTLLEPFCEFPFQTESARSAFAAHILTEAARIALDRVPMFWYTAPDAGTGKSLLCDMASTIVHGTQPARRPWVAHSEEIRKTLFASLLAGDRSIAFDNVPTGHKARSAELCAFLTSSVWKDRKLGASEAMRVVNRSVVSATGNNVTPVADMARRSLVIRLDANSLARRQRRFKIANLEGYVQAHRVELLMAALTVIRGWQQHKRTGAVPLPSFEEWSYLVRDALIWLGMPDPIETQSDETDDETGAIHDAFTLLGNHFQGREFTASSIRDVAYGFVDTDGVLCQALISAGCVDPLSTIKIGYWLRECRDKIGAGYKLIQSRVVHKAGHWVFKRLNNEDLA